ncbi:sigma-54-dependent transcriptional regulator [Exercitatus varius]|uniref:sigma-54-dependent transcriptional regulator n=1 Tax=Exercitatus varius TaxID=67857 RepID=UPI00294B73E9|nr:sigma-54 dependent transcriptional regulator [Exercitatus varius]MDG2962896.1 sigma-54 dependent transcriptional regulator [Exercitatus varius]
MKNKSQVLLIDDDPDVLQAYQALLALESDEKGYEIIALNNPLDAEPLITEDWQGVVVSDIYMPQLSGWQLLERLHEKDKNLPVILITGHGDVPMAIDAMQKGAFYFIEKPVDPERLLQQIDLALTQRQAQLALKHWQQQELETHLIGQSKWIKNLRRRLQQLSQTDLPIFIFGEIGTGKTLTAHYLHELAKTRFPQKQCLELLSECDTEELQSQLNAAQNTTFIIKNIEYLTNAAQKLLAQFILRNPNARIIAVSQYSPQQLLAQAKLLPELFYSFSLTQIECLPLSHRTSDIEPLFRHYLAVTCDKLNKKKPAITEAFIKQLLSQQWLGNISQLIHTAELYAVGITVQNDNLHFTQDRQSELSLDSLIEEYEKNIIADVLDRFQGKINDAAAYLQIPRKKLYLRMKKYDLNKEDYKE